MTRPGDQQAARASRERESDMPLISMKEMLEDARKARYAACYCESWNLESLQAVVEAAEAEKSPIIAGFNGGFLLRSGQTTLEQLGYYACLRAALARAKVPVTFLLNESDSLAQIEQGIDLGFDAVMPENEDLPEGRIPAPRQASGGEGARQRRVGGGAGGAPGGCVGRNRSPADRPGGSASLCQRHARLMLWA